MITEGDQQSKKIFNRNIFLSFTGLPLATVSPTTAKWVLLRDILTEVAKIPF